MTGTRDYFFPAKIQNRVQIKTRGRERERESSCYSIVSDPFPRIIHTQLRALQTSSFVLSVARREMICRITIVPVGGGVVFPLPRPARPAVVRAERDVEEGGGGREERKEGELPLSTPRSTRSPNLHFYPFFKLAITAKIYTRCISSKSK